MGCHRYQLTAGHTPRIDQPVVGLFWWRVYCDKWLKHTVKPTHTTNEHPPTKRMSRKQCRNYYNQQKHFLPHLSTGTLQGLQTTEMCHLCRKTLRDPVGSRQTNPGSSDFETGVYPHKPPSSKSYLRFLGPHSDRLLAGNTDLSTSEGHHGSAPTDGISEHTSAENREYYYEDTLFDSVFFHIFLTITFLPGPWLVTRTPIHWLSTPLLLSNSRERKSKLACFDGLRCSKETH